MLKKQLVSFRLEGEILSKISDLLKNRPYCTRNAAVNHLLKAFLFCSDEDSMIKLLDCYDPFDEKIKICVTKLNNEQLK